MDRLGQVNRTQTSSWRTRSGLARLAGLACVIALLAWALAGRNDRSSEVSAAGGTISASADPDVNTSATTTPTASWLRPEGYLAIGSDFVAFIQWTTDHGYLSGTAETVGTVGSPPDAATASDTVDVIGTRDGDRVTLTFGGQTDEIDPTEAGGFTIGYPSPDGAVIDLHFRRASTAAFERAVTALASAADDADRVQASAQARRKAEHAVDTDVSNLSITLADIPGAAAAAAADLSAIPLAVSEERAARAIADSDEQSVSASDAAGSTRCGLSDPVVGETVAMVAGDELVGRLVRRVESDLAILRSDIADLTTESAQRLTDTKATPGYKRSARPTPATVTSAATRANASIVHALAAVNGDIDVVNAAVRAAVSDTRAAEQAGGCPGTVPTASALPHIA